MPALTIGGATLRLHGRRRRTRASALYRPYLRSGGSPSLDLALDSHDSAPATESLAPTYDSGTGWGTVEDARGWSFTFGGAGRPGVGRPYCTVRVDRRWRRGTLLGPGPARAGAFPLHYPIEQVLLVSLLARSSGLVVHATGVVHAGRGWVFAGTHGAGKSTLAALFARRRALTVLSDDRVVVRRVGHDWRVFGTPWAGTVRRTSGISAPLAAVLLIRHGDATRATRLAPGLVVPRLLARCFHPYWDRVGLEKMLDTASRLATDVAVYDFPFVPDADAVLDAVARRPRA